MQGRWLTPSSRTWSASHVIECVSRRIYIHSTPLETLTYPNTLTHSRSTGAPAQTSLLAALRHRGDRSKCATNFCPPTPTAKLQGYTRLNHCSSAGNQAKIRLAASSEPASESIPRSLHQRGCDPGRRESYSRVLEVDQFAARPNGWSPEASSDRK